MNNTKQMMLAWTVRHGQTPTRLFTIGTETDEDQTKGDEAWVTGWLDNTTGQPYGANSNVDMLIT